MPPSNLYDTNKEQSQRRVCEDLFETRTSFPGLLLSTVTSLCTGTTTADKFSHNMTMNTLALVVLLLIVALVCMLFLPEESEHLLNSTTNTARARLGKIRRRLIRNEGVGHSRKSNNDGTALHSPHRIAILIPFVGEDAASIPPYFDLFCVAAAGSHELVDFLIIHNGVLESYDANNEHSKLPSNVRLINLGSMEALAKALLRVLPTGEGAPPLVLEHGKLVKVLTKQLQLYPYLLVEFKPALGYIFQEYLIDGRYTHWGYADLDMIFGDLPRWITQDELDNYDIVTYGFGDQHRLYLRGQFTFHRISSQQQEQPQGQQQQHDENESLLWWRKCDYLSKLDQRFASVLAGETNLQFESAEGCYSSVIFEQPNLKVKYAVKAFTDIEDHDTSNTHGLYISLEQGKTIIYKRHYHHHDSGGNERARIISPTWFYALPYSSKQQPLQSDVGELQRIIVPWQQEGYQDQHKNNNAEEKHVKCMYWAREKYQSKLCLDEEQLNSHDTVFWLDGMLYKQKHENVALPVATAPFFHFQEWKRFYRTAQLASFSRNNPSVSTFLLTKEGAIPVLTQTHYPPHQQELKRTLPSPMGFFKSRRKRTTIRSILPHQRYCLQSAPRKFPPVPPAPECLFVVSWQDEAAVKLLSTAPAWAHYVDVDRDVTLTLTLQISALQARSADVLKGMLDLAIANIRSWQGQPCVLILDVAGVEVESLEVLQSHLTNSLGDSGSVDTCLLAAIYRKDEGFVSRKALLNMAQDAAPTRWSVNGVEVERGMVLASDACYFVHETARAHRDNPGHVFFIPQFALKGAEYDTALSLHGLLESKQSDQLSEPAKFEKGRCEEDEKMVDPLAPATSLWWESLKEIVVGTSESEELKTITERSLAIDNIELSLMRLLTSAAHYQLFAMDHSPILLVDSLGPKPGMHTSELAREVEEFGGKQCYNGLKLAQLVTMGYHFNVVSGAFAASTITSREVASLLGDKETTSGASRCDGCFMFDSEHDEIVEAIARDERQRPAKAAILWDELSTFRIGAEL